LSYILVKKTYLKENEEGTALEMQSYLSKEEDSGKRDGMLKIGRLSQGFSVFKTFSSQDDFFEMIETSTPQTVLELDNCFEESRSTRRIQLLEWPRELDLLTLRKNTCIITAEDIKTKLNVTDPKDAVTRAVNVSKLDMNFFFHNKKRFVAFTQTLINRQNEVYSSIFVNSLLDQFWSDT